MTGYYDPDGGEKIYFTWIYDSNGDYFAESDFTGKVSGEWKVDTDKLCFNTMKVATAGADEEFLCSFVYTKYDMVYYLLNDFCTKLSFCKNYLICKFKIRMNKYSRHLPYSSRHLLNCFGIECKKR